MPLLQHDCGGDAGVARDLSKIPDVYVSSHVPAVMEVQRPLVFQRGFVAMRHWLIAACALFIVGLLDNNTGGERTGIAGFSASVGGVQAASDSGSHVVRHTPVPTSSIVGNSRSANFSLMPGFGHNVVAFTERAAWADWVSALWNRINSQIKIWIGHGLKHTPVLVMGLGIMLLVPPLAMAGMLMRWSQSDSTLTQRFSGGAITAHSGAAVPDTIEPAFARDAILEIEGRDGDQDSPRTVYTLGRSDVVVRIGREDDNEIQIRDHTVHRYHAAIDRCSDSGIAISDLSSEHGNGVVVNGKRVARAQLSDGDRIGLGAVTLLFRMKRE